MTPAVPAALDDRREERRLLHFAHLYFQDEPGRRAAERLLTKHEARRMAANFAKLPELLHRTDLANVIRITQHFHG
jgi:hypothetical protein